MNTGEKAAKKSRTNWIMLLLNSGACLALLFSYLATHVSPSDFGYFALFGLGYPFILAVNLLFIFYWLLKKKKYALISAGLILAGFNHFSNFFQISFSEKAGKDETTLSVLTYNVHLFDLYNQKSGKQTRNKIFDLLDRAEADVICFQEFYHTDRKGGFITRDSLVKFLPNKFVHERYTHALAGSQYFGVAMLSRYPIIKKGFVPFASDVNNFCIYIDILKEKDTVRIYNAHLQSIRFRPEDYALVDGNKNSEELDKGSKRIARRLKDAFVKREEQVNRIVENIKTCPHEVVLCGDFNDTPVSYTYGTFSDLLEDSFKEAGNGIGNTYIGVFPSFRIDYILHSKGLEAIEYTTFPEKLSDHHAVRALLKWKNEQ